MKKDSVSIYYGNINTEDLNEQANIVESYEESMGITKKYKDTIKTNKKNIIFFAYKQGKVFSKLKEDLKIL